MRPPFRRSVPPLDSRVGLEHRQLKRGISAQYASNFSPLIQPMGAMPIEFDVMRSIELAVFPVPTFATTRKFITNKTKPVGVSSFPTSTVERLLWKDTGAACITIEPDAIGTAPTTYELARMQFNQFGTGVVEEIATFFRIEALDADEAPIFEFTTFPADAEPCALPLVHPDPAVLNPLRLRYRLIAQDIPDSMDGNANIPRLLGSNPNFVPLGLSILTPWGDNRYGWGGKYTDRHQFVIGDRCLIRLFVDVSADPNRWKINKMTGRLAGYWHRGGLQGAALRSASERVV